MVRKLCLLECALGPCSQCSGRGVSQLLLLEKCGQKKAVGHKYMIGSLLDTEGLI